MLLTKQTIIEYVVDTPAGPETLKFTFPGQTDPAWQAAKKKFLDNRYVQKGRKMVNVSNDARIALFDQHCLRVDTLEEPNSDGGTNNIMEAEGWQKKVPVEIKVAIISQGFEEKESLSAEDQEDLSPASVGV
tara:strand:+ start:93 stop:488 length:396 start_codon:yes stop_codon:yes gene_type:complete